MMKVRLKARLQATLACLAAAGSLSAVILFPSRDPGTIWPDGAEYADMAIRIARGEGFRVSVVSNLSPEQQPHDGLRHPSRYPPGYPMALAPFALASADQIRGVQLGSRVLSGLYLLTLFGCSWLLAGPVAAAIAAVAAAGSPFLATSSQVVMADAFGATLAVGVGLAIEFSGTGGKRQQGWGIALAGFFAGWSVLARLSNIVVPFALLAGLRDRRSRGVALAGGLPVAALLAAYQWATYGRPWMIGYSYWFPGVPTFSLANVARNALSGDGPWICPDLLRGLLMAWVCPCPEPGGPMAGAANILFYPSVLLGLFWVFTPPLFSLLAIPFSIRERGHESVRYFCCLVAANLLLVLPYSYRAARLVAPAASALLILAACGLATFLIRALPQRAEVNRLTADTESAAARQSGEQPPAGPGAG